MKMLTTVREDIIEDLKGQMDNLLLAEEDYERIADTAIFAFAKFLDNEISSIDQSDYKTNKTRRKTLEHIREMLDQ